MKKSLYAILLDAINRTEAEAIAKALDTGEEVAESPVFTMKVLIIYGDPQMRLHGIHIHGHEWEMLGLQDYQFTQQEINDTFKALGLDLIGRPVKQPALYYHWLVARVAEPDLRMIRWMGNESRDRALNYAAFKEAVAA